jgi:hypothetical protein
VQPNAPGDGAAETPRGLLLAAVLVLFLRERYVDGFAVEAKQKPPEIARATQFLEKVERMKMRQTPKAQEEAEARRRKRISGEEG